MQLYVNTGELERARKLANTASELARCKEFMMLNTYIGEQKVATYGETLLKTLKCCADMMISGVMLNKNLKPAECVQIIRGAVSLFDLAAPDGNFGEYHVYVSHIFLYLSVHLWLAEDRNGAFEALDTALYHAKRYDSSDGGKAAYTSPLLKTMRYNRGVTRTASGLPDDWPWWCVPDYSHVKAEMQADHRWDEWVSATRQ